MSVPLSKMTATQTLRMYAAAPRMYELLRQAADLVLEDEATRAKSWSEEELDLGLGKAIQEALSEITEDGGCSLSD